MAALGGSSADRFGKAADRTAQQWVSYREAHERPCQLVENDVIFSYTYLYIVKVVDVIAADGKAGYSAELQKRAAP